MMVLFYTFLSCGEEDTHSSIENPSGDCLSEDNGSRLCYHTPSATDRYLKDCTNGLQREYWAMSLLKMKKVLISSLDLMAWDCSMIYAKMKPLVNY